jgi:hypothetical protein
MALLALLALAREAGAPASGEAGIFQARPHEGAALVKAERCDGGALTAGVGHNACDLRYFQVFE